MGSAKNMSGEDMGSDEKSKDDMGSEAEQNEPAEMSRDNE